MDRVIPMEKFEKEHPDWAYCGTNKQCHWYRKDDQFMFLDFSGGKEYGPVTQEEVFSIGQVLYTTGLEGLTEEHRTLAEKFNVAISEEALIYGLSQELLDPSTQRWLAKKIMEAELTSMWTEQVAMKDILKIE